jgi:hypothetical protein
MRFARALATVHAYACKAGWGAPRYAQFEVGAAALQDLAATYHAVFECLDAPARLALQQDAQRAIATMHYSGGHNAVFVAAPGRAEAPSGTIRFSQGHAEIQGDTLRFYDGEGILLSEKRIAPGFGPRPLSAARVYPVHRLFVAALA